MTEHTHHPRPVVSREALAAILGMKTEIPTTPAAMARSLRVTFYPVYAASDRLRQFSGQLREALTANGANVIEYADALADPHRGKLREDVVVITTGEQRAGDLAVDHISNLRKSTVVALVDGPCPADLEAGSQEKLNRIVQALSWHFAMTVLFVDETSWTITTMNGAIIKCDVATFQRDVFEVLIPKIAAPVVPPHASDFDIREGALDLQSTAYQMYVDDFRESGPLWEQTRLMLFHTSLDLLEFRNRYYKKLAAAFLDHRSGMSYGFLARQVACRVEAARPLSTLREFRCHPEISATGFCRTDDGMYVLLDVDPEPLVARVPEVWMLTTRSGCDKSHIDASRDIVLMGLSDGKVIFATPRGVNHGIDCKPSYDTLTILSHAIGNALVGSVEALQVPGSRFLSRLQESGVALAHWHGSIELSVLPAGYVVYGEDNPPVSCSTFQAAIFALTGKLQAYASYRRQAVDYAGDAHLEPHHGVNITGSSLVGLAEWALQHSDALSASLGEEYGVQQAE